MTYCNLLNLLTSLFIKIRIIAHNISVKIKCKTQCQASDIAIGVQLELPTLLRNYLKVRPWINYSGCLKKIIIILLIRPIKAVLPSSHTDWHLSILRDNFGQWQLIVQVLLTYFISMLFGPFMILITWTKDPLSFLLLSNFQEST